MIAAINTKKNICESLSAVALALAFLHLPSVSS